MRMTRKTTRGRAGMTRRSMGFSCVRGSVDRIKLWKQDAQRSSVAQPERNDMHPRLRTVSLTALIAILAISPMQTLAQGAASVAIPRTAEGRPDFHGVWASRWLTPVERSSGVEALIVDGPTAEKLAAEILARAANPTQLDPELAFPDASTLAIVRGEYRTSLVIKPDYGRLPMTAAGRSRMRTYVSGADGPEQRMTTERCLGGVGWAPLQIRTASMLRRIVQTPEHIVLHTEAYSDLRIIGINRRPLPSSMRPAGGDSIAHWEGDALIVETRNLDPETSTHGIVTVLSPEAVITERFELASPNELVYRYTVTDPAYYSEPWTAEYSLTRSADQIYEFACHEGNYSMVGILAGARSDAARKRP